MVRKGTHHLWAAFDVIERWITLAQFIQLPRRVAYCNPRSSPPYWASSVFGISSFLELLLCDHYIMKMRNTYCTLRLIAARNRALGRIERQGN